MRLASVQSAPNTSACANDHLVFSVPWLDSPTALAAAVEASGQMTLATTVALVAVRGPVPAAKSLAAIDLGARYPDDPERATRRRQVALFAANPATGHPHWRRPIFTVWVFGTGARTSFALRIQCTAPRLGIPLG